MLMAHALPKENFAWVLINQFHMPFFFIISGYLYKKKDKWLDFLLGKIRGLWVPYVLSSVITIMFSLAWRVSGNKLFLLKRLIKAGLLLEPGPLLGAMWFIQVLFYSILLYDLIVRIINRAFELQSEIVISVIVVVLLVVGINTHLPYHCSVILNTVFFIHLGQLMKNHRHWASCKIPMFFVLFSVCVIISILNKTSYTTNTYTNPMLFIVSALTGSIGIIGICKYVYRENYLFRGLAYLGEKSKGPLIWQFVAFKIVIAFQIVVYRLSWERIIEFPVIYEYASGFWILLDIIIGLTCSIIIYRIINEPADKLVKKIINRIREKNSKCK